MQINLSVPDQTSLVAEASATLTVAKSIKIDSPEMYVQAARELQEIKGRAKALDERRKAITKPLDESKQAIMDLFRSPLAVLTEAECLLKRAIISWDAEQERLRKAEEDRLREEARKERERLEAEARKAEEVARKKAEELRRKAEAEAAAGNAAKAQALADKAAATVENASEKAAHLHTQAAVIQAPVVVREAPKVAGISMRTRWKARVVNASLIPREYMVPNDKALDDIAAATKGSIKIPGVEFVGIPEVASARR